MKDLTIVIPTVNLSNITRSPSTSLPCSPTSNRQAVPYEYDGCMLCTNGTPSCLQKRRATWTLKLRVALFCLSVLHPDKRYFNLKKDIYTYVDNHWDLLSINTAKSDRWRKQVQDSLSHCRHFESGWDAMGCNGHWRLIQPLNPWSFPPEKESIMDDEGDMGNYTPDASLSPRPTKSPREDPLYRNFPKRRPLPHQSNLINSNNTNNNQNSYGSGGEEEGDNRKRKAEELPAEEELVMLKYSPCIYSDTPSPKCRTPRNNNPSTTSPSIIGSSPMMTSGNYFSLSNFSNNLTLSQPSQLSDRSHYHPQQTNQQMNLNLNQQQQQTSTTSTISSSIITILESNPLSPGGHSPVSSPTLGSAPSTFKISPPIPSIPFTWRNSSTTPTTTTSIPYSPTKNSSPISLLNDSNESITTPREVKVNTLPVPNPFGTTGSPKYTTPSPNFFSSNSSIKVPSELLLKASQGDKLSINSLSSPSPPPSGSTSPNNLTKLQQQNLILNCTY